jgi:predicted kinase
MNILQRHSIIEHLKLKAIYLNNMTQKLIMCKGLPASGKSTWAKEYARNNSNFIRINNDDLRESFSAVFSKENEKALGEARDGLIDKYINS